MTGASAATFHHHSSFGLLCILSAVSALLLQTCHGDVGTALKYTPPYIPAACYGEDTTEFPSNNLFAAAGQGIWNNGAACGRQYLVSCISSQTKGISCIEGASNSIQIKIVDYVNSAVSITPSHIPPGTTLVLSEIAFESLVQGDIKGTTSPSINIEFKQV